MEEITNILINGFDYIRPLLEIGILTVLIYNCLYFLRGTRGAHILAGITIIMIVLTTLSDYLKFEVISWLFNNIWAIIPVGMLVIFQPELRRAFAQLGTTPFTSRKKKKEEALNEVVQAVTNMSRQHVGALIIFEREIGMRAIINTAVRVDGVLTRQLIESIFYPNTPLHDGAVIIKDARVVAAHAILPLSQDESLVRTLGTRHRAAIGISEETDAVALIVSEETGIISIACGGRIRRDIKPDKLQRFLQGLLLSDDRESNFREILSSMQQDGDGFSNGFGAGELNNE